MNIIRKTIYEIYMKNIKKIMCIGMLVMETAITGYILSFKILSLIDPYRYPYEEILYLGAFYACIVLFFISLIINMITFFNISKSEFALCLFVCIVPSIVISGLFFYILGLLADANLSNLL